VIRMLITDGSGPPDPAVTGADVDFIQVREPCLTVFEIAKKVRGLIHANGPRILVNDRADVAIACGAAGVHLRDDSVSPEMIRRIAPPGFVFTVACHDAAGVFRAADEGADYAVLAPIFAPLSKPPSRPPLGIEVLRAIASRAKIPVIALGGITSENTPLCIEAGAAGVAGISMFHHHRDSQAKRSPTPQAREHERPPPASDRRDYTRLPASTQAVHRNADRPPPEAAKSSQRSRHPPT